MCSLQMCNRHKSIALFLTVGPPILIGCCLIHMAEDKIEWEAVR